VLLAAVLVDAFVVPRRWRGLLTGLAVGVKITPGVVIVYWLLRRELRAALQAGGAFLVTVIVGLLLVPGDSQNFWLHDVHALGRFGPEATSWGNQSVVAVIERASQLREVPHAVLTSATIASVLTTVALGLLAARRRLALDDSLGALTSIALSGLLIAPISWTHHWVWVVPAIFVFFRDRSWWWVVLTSVVFFLPPMWGLANRPTSQLGYSPAELGLSAAWLLWAVALLACWAWPGRAFRALTAPAAEPEADVSPPREYVALTSGAGTQ
jgi:alpha-1,2-mannosyltransferase